MSRIDTIHFDMDGVIADTEPFHVEAEQQTCRDYDFAIDPSSWGGFKGQTATAIFTHLIQAYGDPRKHNVNELIDYKTNLFLEMAQKNLTPIDGVLDFLEWSRRKFEKMTLVTSSNRRVQGCIVARFGIRDYFDYIVTGDDVANGKPHPEPYVKAMQNVARSGERSLVIEDSKSGIKSAIDAGCSVLAIATSHSTNELLEAKPTLTAADYPDAIQQIDGLLVA